jgi:hypothetical protein
VNLTHTPGQKPVDFTAQTILESKEGAIMIA